MNYEVLEKATGETETMSDRAIEQKFGAMGFTQMVADTHDTHVAVDLGGSMNEDDFLEMDDNDDDYRDILDSFG